MAPPVIDPSVEIRLVENQAHTPISGGGHGGECAMASTGPAFAWVDETAVLGGGLALADQ